MSDFFLTRGPDLMAINVVITPSRRQRYESEEFLSGASTCAMIGPFNFYDIALKLRRSGSQ